jgi:hypothetical protein
MPAYTIHGWTTGGWDVYRAATSLRKAIAEAREVQGEFEAKPDSKVTISKDGAPVKAWSGTTAGKWIAVVP